MIFVDEFSAGGREKERKMARGTGQEERECRCTVYLFRSKYCLRDVIVDFQDWLAA